MAIAPKLIKADNRISIRNLSFFYGSIQALRNVSLTMPARQVTGLIGPSGCGKSTLLRVLNRMYDRYPDQRATGSVLIGDDEILSLKADLQRLRRNVGMVFQDSTVFPMSVYGNISYGICVHESLCRADLATRVEESLTRADLWSEVKDRLSDSAASLSGGEQQRLCIARALATRPEVLLLDEPTSALDPISTSKIELLIRQLKKHLTVVLVTHNLLQGARCADQVAFLYLGELIESGTVHDIFHTPKHRHTQDYIAGRFG